MVAIFYILRDIFSHTFDPFNKQMPNTKPNTKTIAQTIEAMETRFEMLVWSQRSGLLPSGNLGSCGCSGFLPLFFFFFFSHAQRPLEELRLPFSLRGPASPLLRRGLLDRHARLLLAQSARQLPLRLLSLLHPAPSPRLHRSLRSRRRALLRGQRRPRRTRLSQRKRAV